MLSISALGWVYVPVRGLLVVKSKALKLVKWSIAQEDAFRIAAQSLCRSRSALGAFYRRLRSRLGAPKAITATAHKLARMFYRLWTTRQTYTDPGADYYEQQYRERMVNNLKKKALSLCFELVAQSQ